MKANAVHRVESPARPRPHRPRRHPHLRGHLLLCATLTAPTLAEGWERIASVTPPPSPRRGVAGIVDAGHQRLVLQGAETAEARFLRETWFFTLDTHRWEKPALDNPGARCHHTFLVDPTRGRGVMFGGFPRNHELWEFDPSADRWRNLTPAEPNPLARCLHASVLCPARDEMILFGGLNGGFAPDLDDTWSLNLQTGQWSLLEAHSPPGRRYGSVLALDARRDRLVLFGGLARSAEGAIREVNDLWSFDLATRQWRPLPAVNEGPSPRQFARGLALPRGDGLLLFGGKGPVPPGTDEPGFKNDLWFLDFAEVRWRRVSPPGAPPPGRFRHTLLLNERDDTLWLLFGQGRDQHFNDLWRLDLRHLPLEPGAVRIHLIRDSVSAPPGFELRWRARPVRFLATAAESVLPDYTVEWSADLLTWHTLIPLVQAAPNGDPTERAVQLPSSNRRAFYRVVNLPRP